MTQPDYTQLASRALDVIDRDLEYDRSMDRNAEADAHWTPLFFIACVTVVVVMFVAGGWWAVAR